MTDKELDRKEVTMSDEKKIIDTKSIRSYGPGEEIPHLDHTRSGQIGDLEVKVHEPSKTVDNLQLWQAGREAMLSTMTRNVYTKLFGGNVVFLIPQDAPYQDQYKWGWIPLVTDDVEFEDAVDAGFTKDFHHWQDCTNTLDFQQRLAARDIPEYREAMEAREPVDMAVLSNPENFVEQPAVWQGTVSDEERNRVPVPTAFEDSLTDQLRDGKTLGMTLVYPSANWSNDHELAGPATKLLIFWNRLNEKFLATQKHWGTPVEPHIYLYHGHVGDDEATWVRFQYGEVSQTFVVAEKDFDKFVNGISSDVDLNWAKSANGRENWEQVGYHLNVSKLPIELPLSWYFRPMFDNHFRGLVDGDFRDLHSLTERLKKKVAENLRDVTTKSMALVNFPYKRDHDMYLAFKATDKDMQVLNVSLEKVFPQLPESGEISIGDHPINLFEWNVDKKMRVTVMQILNLVKQTNREIERVRRLVNQHPLIQEQFKQEVKTIMYAATHFTKKLYGCKPEDVQEQVMQVTDNVVRALTAKGGRIGLDLNSWIVWEYHDDKAPTKVTDKELDFVSLILNRYTDSFVEALYAYLLNLGNPFIKPYDYRVKADASDGIELGSIRRS